MDEHSNSCVAENSRELDKVDDHQLEGELPIQDQAPLDIKNHSDPPPPRPDMNADETTGSTPKGTGPGTQALDQMVPKIIEDIADMCIPQSDNPSLQDVSNEEEEEKDPSPTHSLSSLNDKVTQRRYREPDRVLGDPQLEGEPPTQDQAPLDIKNLGGPPQTRKYINTEETAGHGPQALDQMLPQITEDIAGDPSFQDVSYEEDTSLPRGLSSLSHGLSSLDDKVIHRPTAGGDNSTQESSAMGMEREEENEEGEDEVHSRATDELFQVTKRSISNTSETDHIKKRNISQSVRVNHNRLKSFEMVKAMNLLKRDKNNIQTDVVSLKSENYDRKKESAENKREMSALRKEMINVMQSQRGPFQTPQKSIKSKRELSVSL
ncbi:uncharacterized protein LOC115922365 [Strongylocentrotus purpuratus]|uniref:Uncharacterized protein n=1 Tax=Strongylocentrotus purpuratus TaxID=7668 RepID=A0A7M7NIK5_STRPU|nr:uncharacterized protein LOC115922365 [Strongylocentrotus purpuratus]